MKRGESGLSLVVGVDKPSGMSSHDVVNCCRSVFGEKRVGHMGTLDPLASGVLPICIGPATRLASFFLDHDKCYTVRIAFGASTTTDDAEGEILHTAAVPDEVFDPAFAQSFAVSLIGVQKQMPPVYSALKVDGVKACDAARRGRIIDLSPREIEVFDAHIEGIEGFCPGESPVWEMSLHVSKGTYIRSLARDIGTALGTCAHVATLRRTRVGALGIDECVGLDTLADIGASAALDPVRLLGNRLIFVDASQERLVANGGALDASSVELFEMRKAPAAAELCACTAGVCASADAPYEGELVSLIAQNKLFGVYAYDEKTNRYLPRCVFQKGVSRGFDI